MLEGMSRKRLTEQTAIGLAPTSGSRVVLGAQRLVLGSSRTPLRHVWSLAYRVLARGVIAVLIRGEPGAAVYARGSFGGSEFVPGLSDVDLAIIVAGKDAAERVRRRWVRLARALPPVGLVVDIPRVYAQDALRELAGTSTLTYAGAAYTDPPRTRDAVRMLERPELDGATAAWRPLRGPDRRPATAPRDAQAQRVAAWLELVYWWRWAFSACAGAPGPRLAAQCVKLVAEPGRIWLVLRHGERTATREEALALLLRRLPEEEAALLSVIALQQDLARAPEPPLADILPVLIGLSKRIAAVLCEQLAEAPVTEVALAGDAAALPLADWRALVCPPAADERLLPIAGDVADPGVLGSAALAHETGPYPVLRTGELLLLPGVQWMRTRMRSVQCAATDPVSFALLDGARTARFPAVAGWSIHDAARRAVTEHAARLRAAPGDFGALLTAARAGLLEQSLRRGAPELALTAADAVARLPGDAGAEALHHHRAGTPPPPAVVAALRERVLALLSPPAP
jgi:hypothetical protein